MNVAVFGLGYVGTVTAACLASLGHRVIGVDIDPAKVAAVNDGRSPVAEPGIAPLIADAVGAGRLDATDDTGTAVAGSDLALVCVGTPSRRNGDIDLAAIDAVSDEIAQALATTGRSAEPDGSDPAPYVVVIRSTVVPGTSGRVAARLAKADAGGVGPRVEVAVNPEFLREGQAVDDFLAPPLIVVGADDQTVAERVLGLYHGIEADRLVESTGTTELMKYASNSWHATKVTFANEIGLVAKALGVDGVRVMELLCRDRKLNISAAYLRPGFAFGGSCLPKDVRALTFLARDNDVSVPLLASLMTSNGIQVQRIIDLLVDQPARSIGFIGLSFKPDTDDLRESPIVEVIERMLGKGFDCRVADPDVTPVDLVGGNRDHIEREIPHLERILVDRMADLVSGSEVLVVSKASPGLTETLTERSPDQLLIDLVGLDPEFRHGRYQGVAW